jgi:cell division protein FtsW
VADIKKIYAGYDFMILIPTLILMGLGLVMVYSASSHIAAHQMGNSHYFFRRQVVFCLLGLALLVFTKNLPSSLYRRLAYPLLGISASFLAMLFVPGLGVKVGGATRWLRIVGISFQPSELAKFSLALYMAYSMARKGPSMGSFSKGLVPHLMVAGAFMLLILLQPDLGTAVILGSWILILLFVGGVNLLHLFGVLLVFAPAVLWLIWRSDYRLKRWWAFLNPWEDPTGVGFQIVHSFLAFGSGGIFGLGLGNSKQKLFYLPEPHTDFVFSVVAEELGFLGVTLIVVLFGFLIVRGIRVSLLANDLYSSYLAFAISSLLGLQVLVNMGVVMGLLPTKGLTLPLMSYGGSSLVINLLGIGILLNISSRR